MRVSYPIRMRAPRARKEKEENKKKKKKLGAGQKVRVKKGRRGPIKSPLPRQKALDAVRPRVPVTLWLSKSRQKPRKGGDQPSALEALPSPSLGQGAGEITRCPLRRDHLLGLKKCVAARQNRRGKITTRQEKHTKTPAASRPRKRASEQVPGES